MATVSNISTTSSSIAVGSAPTRNEDAAHTDDLFLRKSERRFHDVLVPSAGDIAQGIHTREVNAYIDPLVVRFLDPKPSDRRALSPYEHERALTRLQEMAEPMLQSGDLSRRLHSFFATEKDLLHSFQSNRTAVIPC